MTGTSGSSGGLAAEVARARWYHTIELPEGVVTPGEYDLRPALGRVPLPASLAGSRCLDVGIRDGFWAFEMERRGGSVVGIDLDDVERLDWPLPRPAIPKGVAEELEARGRTFRVARGALGSSVEKRDLSVYDLDPDDAGLFDFAVIGTLLLHLRDPVGALDTIRGVLAPGGRLLVNEAVSLSLSVLRPRRPAALLVSVDDPFWWVPNVAGLRRQVVAAGFRVMASGRPYLLPTGPGFRPLSFRERMRSGARLREELILRRGMPHAWVLAEPAV